MYAEQAYRAHGVLRAAISMTDLPFPYAPVYRNMRPVEKLDRIEEVLENLADEKITNEEAIKRIKEVLDEE